MITHRSNNFVLFTDRKLLNGKMPRGGVLKQEARVTEENNKKRLASMRNKR